MPSGAEFTVTGHPTYDRRGPVRWILSHQARNPWPVAGFLIGSVVMVVLNSMIPGYIGEAVDAVAGADPDRARTLTWITIALLVIVLARSGFDLIARFCSEVLAKRMERGARDELYVSLLGKSQTFHNRQRVGDLMARGANDVKQLGGLFSPGIDLIVDSMTQGIVPLIFIAFLDWRLLLAPLLFAVVFILSIRHFMRQLEPVSARMRARFGDLNAGLNEAVRGIEVVKATAQEPQESAKFHRHARDYRDDFVKQGWIQALYLPTLLLAVATAGGLLHALYLMNAGELTVGGVIAYLGLFGLLGFPTFISIFSFSLVQLGLAGAGRILDIMTQETELDRAEAHAPDATGPESAFRSEPRGPDTNAHIRGDIAFENVTFGYDNGPVLQNISFEIKAGQTVAIVGETGSGKSTLTKLVNRIYDADSGRVLVDGIDVRQWNLDSLRSQISAIEQDIVLFSRTVAENIAFSMGQRVDHNEVVQAAKDARADEFINELEDGYQTVIGERGVTLSGGQRQRLAIARALITDPAILVLDDSTSAIDSATEDEIQKAIRRILEGRTTLLITHRLSQIRWADTVLLLRRGELVDTGTHDELMARCGLYQRIFAHSVPGTAAGTDAASAVPDASGTVPTSASGTVPTSASGTVPMSVSDREEPNR